MNVLIIDDEDAIREVFKDDFESLGLKVFEATNGKSGLDILLNESIDLVLTDIQMPIMNGYEFLLEAKKINKIVPPIFVMTGGCKYTKQQLCENGAIAYFDKVNLSARKILGYLNQSA